MYLTRAYLNPRRQGAIKLLSNPRALHALLMGCFPDQPPTHPGEPAPRILWRLDPDDPHRPHLWIVSPTRPDLTQLIEDAGWPAAQTPQWQSKSYTPLLDRLEAGQRYAFRLTANPTYRLAPPAHDQRGRRVPHTTARDQIRWLTEKASCHGFTIPHARHATSPTDEPALQISLRHRNKTRLNKQDHHDKPIRVTLTTASYEGALDITDPHAFRTLLTTGIGQGRAYGCGLLTIASQPAHAKKLQSQ
jgi:CRISPR system Cascade subunit CasE